MTASRPRSRFKRMLAKLLKLAQVDERFVIDEFEPAYLKLFRAGKLDASQQV